MNQKNYHFRWVQNKLEEFWNSKGVSILNSYDLEMGAGTYSPFSTIKMLENNNLSVGFVQKCRRPYDNMEGNDGNRLYIFHQFQVMLKGLRTHVVEDFIDSLKFLGLDTNDHDLKFIESDWNSPTIGAYGVGWEVQWDGMEIAQFTYFKKIGLHDCQEPITELTYGMERLLMKLNNTNNIYNCMWDAYNSYDNITKFFEQDFKKAQEVLQSALNLNDFNHYMDLGDKLLSNGSIYHSYEYFVKACHIYNLLESQNKIGSLQRTLIIKQLSSAFSQCLSNVVDVEIDIN